MTKNWQYTAVVCCAIFLNFLVVQKVVTQKAISSDEFFNYTTAPQYLETPKPKIDVIKSSLCKKCNCNTPFEGLHCTNKSITRWFSDEEWIILQHGNFHFESIFLSYNSLTNIPQLRTYPVKNLFLGFNMITDIAIGAFVNLTKLTYLDLTGNKLTSNVMVPAIFGGRNFYGSTLPEMRVLYLGENKLHNLDPALFRYTPNLEELILRNNSFYPKFDSRDFSIEGLKSLKSLDLSYMKLQNFPFRSLHSQKLEELILTGNLFEQVPVFRFGVRRLILDGNPIKNLSNEYDMPAGLEYLSISHMPELKHISRGAFGYLPNLTELKIAYNPKLSSIDANAFGKSIYYFGANETVHHYPPLKRLNLRGNNLTRLEYDVHVQWANITFIDLSDNPWICDCNNTWLIYDLMSYTNGEYQYFSSRVKCSSPETLKNVPLKDLNLNKTPLNCETDYGQQESGISSLVVLWGVIIGVLLIVGILVHNRRNCFRPCNHSDTTDKRLQYEPI